MKNLGKVADTNQQEKHHLGQGLIDTRHTLNKALLWAHTLQNEGKAGTQHIHNCKLWVTSYLFSTRGITIKPR